MRLTDLGKCLAVIYGTAFLLACVWYQGIPDWTLGILGNLIVIALAKVVSLALDYRRERRVRRLVRR